MFESMENYQRYKRFLYTISIFKAEFNHLVYCEDATEKEILEIIRNDREEQGETHESFLLVKNDQISLHTMTKFTDKQCSGAQLAVLGIV